MISFNNLYLNSLFCLAENGQEGCDPISGTLCLGYETRAYIGLVICQKIVAQHSGSIKLENMVDKGTKFIVTLPEKQPGLQSGTILLHIFSN
mgnify:CR=1 FL=1